MPSTVNMVKNLWLESHSLLLYYMAAVSNCPLHSYLVDQDSAQTAFKKFIQQMVVNAETHKWSICPEMGHLYIKTLSQSSETISERGQKNSRSQRTRKTRVEMLYSRTHSSCDNIKPVKILAQYGKGFMSPLSARTVDDRFQKRQSKNFLAGWAVSSRWPHNQVYGSTN